MPSTAGKARAALQVRMTFSAPVGGRNGGRFTSQAKEVPKYFPVDGELSGLRGFKAAAVVGNCSLRSLAFHDNGMPRPRRVGDRLTIRDVEVRQCQHWACSAYGAVFENVVVTDLRGGGRAPSFMWGCLFSRVTLRGWISGLLVRWQIDPEDDSLSREFLAASLSRYQTMGLGAGHHASSVLVCRILARSSRCFGEARSGIAFCNDGSGRKAASRGEQRDLCMDSYCRQSTFLSDSRYSDCRGRLREEAKDRFGSRESLARQRIAAMRPNMRNGVSIKRLVRTRQTYAPSVQGCARAAQAGR